MARRVKGRQRSARSTARSGRPVSSKRKAPPPPLLAGANPLVRGNPAQTASVASLPLIVSGTLTSASTGYPLQGLVVKAFFHDSARAGAPPAPKLLGSGVSYAGGAFQIRWVASPQVSEWVRLIAGYPGYRFVLTAADGGEVLLKTSPMPATGKTTDVPLQVPIRRAPLTRAQWAQVGKRMHAAGLNKLSELVSQLTSASRSIFSDWSVTTRQNALSELEGAFLDPGGALGKVSPLPSWQQLSSPGALDAYQKSLGRKGGSPAVQAAFQTMQAKVEQLGSLSSVDWAVDTSKFGGGPSKAVTAYEGKYVMVNPIAGQFFLPPNLDIGYRDYLRTQWTSMVTLVSYVQPYQLTVQQAEQQLRNRFHQDFRTTDAKTQPANEVLIPILTEILKSPIGGTFGFEKFGNQIPPRGTASAREYLDTLIGLTGVSAQELSLRYRADFTRPDSADSSAVWENIHTLQGFFRDSFQSVPDPIDPTPDVLAQDQPHGQPIVPSVMQGKAPFFLEYEEWLYLHQPINFENYFQIRQVFMIDADDYTRNGLAGAKQPPLQLFSEALELQDVLAKGYDNFDKGEYALAMDSFNAAYARAAGMLQDPVVKTVDVAGQYASRRNKKVSTMDDLQKFVTMWQIPPIGNGELAADWANFHQKALVCSLVYLFAFILPTVMAQTSLATGDYPDAVLSFGSPAYFLVGKATTSDDNAYRFWDQQWYQSWLTFPLYQAGNLPYTVDTEAKMSYYPHPGDDDSAYWAPPYNPDDPQNFVTELVPGSVHPIEKRFFRLQMGGAMLEWADSLYRTDDSASVSRARELYKGVYFLHGAVPPISPSWGAQGPLYPFFTGNVNPAQASQLGRAELGFTQIEAGLNFFGYSEDMVPVLRYTTLKSAADTFAAEAKAAEQDFASFMSQLEEATIESMKNSTMLQKAKLNSQVAQQQAGIAQDQVSQAQIAVSQVNAQIASAEQDIANHDSFWGQLGDYVSGMVGIAKGLPSFFTSGVGAGVAAESGAGSADTAGLLGMGAGASAFAGFAAFAVASYMTISSMADAQNQRAGKLAALQNQALPSAQAQLDIAQRSVSIAGLQQQVAQADAQLASGLLVYAEERYLSPEFWNYMASLARRVLHQFLDLATRMGWLAQRALGYEEDSEVDIIQMSYFQPQQQDEGGADRLLLDLAELEAERLDGLKEMIPIKHTFSLARDFPLQFAQLVSTGQCSIRTSEVPLQTAFPGTYGFRIIAMTPVLSRVSASAPVRGLLGNSGISQIGAEDGSMKVSIRPQDALPISEFNLGTTDMQIYGLPGGTLMQFEGSGIDTIWTLDFPAGANQAGLGALADILLTADLRAQFSPTLYQTQMAKMPTSVSKFVFVSASRLGLPGLADLQGKPAKATVEFDMTTVGLPKGETNRTVNNVAVLVIGAKGAPTIAASLAASLPSPQKVVVTLEGGAAYSNAPPITDPQSTSPPSPLNSFAGDPVDQAFSVVIDKTANAGADFSSVQDVLFGIDYTASV